MRAAHALRLTIAVALLSSLQPVAALAQNTLRVAWNANTEPNIAGYRVSYALQSGGAAQTVDVGNTTTATLNNLTLGRWYNVSVVAYNTLGLVSAPTTVSAFTTGLASFTASPSGTVAPGATVTWTAAPAAGSPALEYEFWMLSNGSWQIARAWASQAVFSKTFAMSDVGQHAVQVWARQPGATANYEAYAGTPVFDVATTPFTITAITSSAVSPFKTGQPVTFGAVVNPPSVTQALEYQFWVLDSVTNSWSIARAYGPGSTFTLTPSWDRPGNYSLQVWARYPGTTVSYAGWLGTQFRVDRGVGTLNSNMVFPVPPGTPIAWTADAGSSSSPLQYQFWVLSQGAWRITQAYSTTKTLTWTPASGDLGADAIQVWVKAAASTATYDAWTGANFEVSRTTPTVVSINLSSPPQTGAATTISATAYGGTSGPLQYRFWVYSPSAGWTMLRDYTSSSTASWTPAAAGSYAVQVWVRSAGATANYEAWLGVGPFAVP